MTLRTTYLIEGLARDELEKSDNVGNARVALVQTGLQTCLTQKLTICLARKIVN